MSGRDLFIEAQCLEKAPVVTFLEEQLVSLPSEFHVSYFGGGERPVKRPQFETANREYFHEYLRQKEYGVALFGDGFSLMAWARDGLPSRLLLHVRKMHPERIGQVPALFELFDKMGMVYVRASLYDEEDARNGYSFRHTVSSPSTGHGWVGRDFRRYVPGLYWQNYLSDSYAEQHGIRIAELAAELGVRPVRLTHGFLLRLYESPLDWREHASRIDEIVFNTPGFFSKRRVSIPEFVPLRESIEVLGRIEREWP